MGKRACDVQETSLGINIPPKKTKFDVALNQAHDEVKEALTICSAYPKLSADFFEKIVQEQELMMKGDYVKKIINGKKTIEEHKTLLEALPVKITMGRDDNKVTEIFAHEKYRSLTIVEKMVKAYKELLVKGVVYDITKSFADRNGRFHCKTMKELIQKNLDEQITMEYANRVHSKRTHHYGDTTMGERT
jgi:hypothetical protein